jgi:hypothetical protein
MVIVCAITAGVYHRLFCCYVSETARVLCITSKVQQLLQVRLLPSTLVFAVRFELLRVLLAMLGRLAVRYNSAQGMQQ